LEVVYRERLRALEVEVPAGLLLDLVDRALDPVTADQDQRHLRWDADQERGRIRLLGCEVAEPAVHLDRDRLLREHDALALARRARLCYDVAHSCPHTSA